MILENEFKIFFNKAVGSKTGMVNKVVKDIEKLIFDYPKIKEERLRIITEKYDEELRDLEEFMNIESGKYNIRN